MRKVPHLYKVDVAAGGLRDAAPRPKTRPRIASEILSGSQGMYDDSRCLIIARLRDVKAEQRETALSSNSTLAIT